MRRIKYYLIGIALFVGGWFIGRLFSGEPSAETPKEVQEQKPTKKKTIYTCSMHPQIRSDKPGKCPICGMPLEPLESVQAAASENLYEIHMSKEAIALADIETEPVKYLQAVRTLSLQGRLAVDERRIATITARFPGRIERLYANFTGKWVRKGAPLVDIYSPELIVAQKEFLESLKLKERYPEVYQAAKEKLLLWGITEKQIEKLEKEKKLIYNFTIYSPLSGVIFQRKVALGDYVKEGTPIVEIAEISRLWVLLDAYEQDLPWIQIGMPVKVYVDAFPHKVYTARITYIDPYVDEVRRIARVRAELNNPRWELKPEMFVKATIETRLKKQRILAVPKSAVLWAGRHAIVYVKKHADESGITFEYRLVKLGVDAGNYYEVVEGLQEGEEVAVHGTFSIDAAAQLAGKYAMLNPPPNQQQFYQVSYEVPQLPPSTKPSPHYEHFLKAYFAFKDALVEDNAQKAQQALKSMKEALRAMNNPPAVAKELLKHLSMHPAKTLEEQRKLLLMISPMVIQWVEQQGVPSSYKALYKDFCPMAGDKGGFWLSQFEAIKNPYFGAAMLKCGSVKKVLKPSQPSTSRKVHHKTSTSTKPSPHYEHFLKAYFAFKDALVEDNTQKAQQALKSMKEALRAMNNPPAVAKELLKHLSMHPAKTLEEQRKLLLMISPMVIQWVEQQGVPSSYKALYKDFCPMAGDNGGFWLSQFEAIKNPYFGAAMLKCGSVKKVLKP